jgi:DNA-binding response OmpR family regulator
LNGKKSVLVIDSNRVLVLAEKRVLQKQGYEVYTASSGSQGLKMAKELKPDVIILDIAMPGLDSYRVCRTLKENDDTANIPVIFLNDRGSSQEKEGGVSVGLREINMAFECGANDFLQKPVAADDLLRSVKNILWFSEISSFGS